MVYYIKDLLYHTLIILLDSLHNDANTGDNKMFL